MYKMIVAPTMEAAV